MDQWSNDGAARVFTFFLGWLFSLIYFCPWLLLYGTIQGIRKLLRRPAASLAP